MGIYHRCTVERPFKIRPFEVDGHQEITVEVKSFYLSLFLNKMCIFIAIVCDTTNLYVWHLQTFPLTGILGESEAKLEINF